MNDSEKKIVEESTKKAVEAIELSIDLLEKLKMCIFSGDLEVAVRAIYGANCIHRYINDRLIIETYELLNKISDKAYDEDKNNNTVH